LKGLSLWLVVSSSKLDQIEEACSLSSAVCRGIDVILGVPRSSARVGSGKVRLVKLHARSLPQLNCAGVRDDGSGETSKSSKLHQYPKIGRSTELKTSANVLPRIRC